MSNGLRPNTPAIPPPLRDPVPDLRWAAEELRLIKRRYEPLLADALRIRGQTHTLAMAFGETVRSSEYTNAIGSPDHWTTIFNAAKAEMVEVVDKFLRHQSAPDDPFAETVFEAAITREER